ncbi:hypothetical protein ACLB1T_01955 [Escherichia coli]
MRCLLNNDTPEKASRTYDAHRDGFVIAGRWRYGAVELTRAGAWCSHLC